MLENNSEYQAWVASRPPVIQEAAKKWPIGTTLVHDGERLWLIGWAEQADGGVTLIFSPINPFEDYDGAQAQKVYICSSHLTPQDANA